MTAPATRSATSSPRHTFILGTRGSALARWQAEHVIAELQKVAPQLAIELRIIKTAGDQDQVRLLGEFEGRGVFTKEIEQALLAGTIDIAVHSLKDLPTEEPDALTIAAILPRADARDVIVSRHGFGLKQLPPGARVGTSSARRAAQVLALRPDVKIVPLRGNVDTRLRKAASQDYDAIVIAAAGLIRLGRASEITEYLPLDDFLPDPGQGALAVQIRADDVERAALLAQLDHAPTRAAVTAERALLQELGGGCNMPVGAYAELDGEDCRLRGMFGARDGRHIVRSEMRGSALHPKALGVALARQLLHRAAAIPGGTSARREPPLRNKRILITRAREQAAELAEKIRAAGGEPVLFPTIEFAPLEDYRALDAALAQVEQFDWVVFTSANGVRAVADRWRVMGSSLGRLDAGRVAAIGPATARALEAHGVKVAFIPTEFLGEQIARELPIEPGQRALLPRADAASDALAHGLRARGVIVTDVDAYRTVMPQAHMPDLQELDAVTFTSSSTVRNFAAMVGQANRRLLGQLDLFCIGPVTAQTARELGLPIAGVAAVHTLDGLVAALKLFYERNEPDAGTGT